MYVHVWGNVYLQTFIMKLKPSQPLSLAHYHLRTVTLCNPTGGCCTACFLTTPQCHCSAFPILPILLATVSGTQAADGTSCIEAHHSLQFTNCLKIAISFLFSGKYFMLQVCLAICYLRCLWLNLKIFLQLFFDNFSFNSIVV